MSGAQSKKASSADGGDRISGLPDDVLHRVLSCLPARDAVRTSVLAGRDVRAGQQVRETREVTFPAWAPSPSLPQSPPAPVESCSVAVAERHRPSEAE